ncbi:MAG: hypothetical protein NWQ38_13310 [Cellulophaga sp.]|nr:hypothetical protein [Cellulophaga sp.]
MMTKIYFLFLFIPVCVGAQSDEIIGDALEKNNASPQFSSFSYPVVGNGEIHSYVSYSYPLTKNFSWKFQASNNTYRLSDLFRFNNSIVYKASDKLYFFSGLVSEFEFDKIENRMLPQRLFSSSGAGYNFTENWNIEAKYEQQLNNTTRTFLSTPTVFSLHSKFKF